MAGEPLDEALRHHRQALRDDREFLRFDTSDYIPLSAVAVPPGLPWQLVLGQIDDAPPPADAVAALRQAIERPDARIVAALCPPFVGQTSAMRRLAWVLADGQGGPAPIFVPLASYAAQPAGGRRLARAIAAAAGAYAPALAEAVDDLLAGGDGPASRARLVFILDGLDDVPRQLRDPLARELLDLADDAGLAGQRFVLSCQRASLPPGVAAAARLLLIQHLGGREVLRYLRSRRGSPAQANARFGQLLDAQLLDLAALPPMLAAILQRLEGDRRTPLTRNQLLQDALDAQLAGLPAPFQRGDAARQSLIALAWEMSWQPDEAIDLNRAFAVLGEVRRERSYSLEDLYDQLCGAGVLQDIDRRRAAFQRPGQRAYCAALALLQRDDLAGALDDLLPQCAVVERKGRWEDVLVSLAGALDDPAPLLRIVRAARATNNGLYMVLLARCLQALPRGVFEQLGPRRRGALLDACAIWADPAREPSAARRAQIAEALGSLPDAVSARALLRLACEAVRPSGERVRHTREWSLDYEYTSVRLSAALGLRSLMIFRPPTRPAGAELWGAVDKATVAALQAWVAAGDGGEASLRALLAQPDAPLEARTLAVFALADLAGDDTDLRHLLRAITAPRPPGLPDDWSRPEYQAALAKWKAIVRTAADALTLCDARRVAALLGQLLRHPPPLDEAAVGQLIYLAGRARAHDAGTLRWLVEQLTSNPDLAIRAKALRSLSWVVSGEPALELGGAPLAPPLLEAARQIGRGQLGGLSLPAPIGAIDDAQPETVEASGNYLRRTALECLRWLPGDAGFAGLAAEAEPWSIELRRALSRSAALRG